MLKMWGVAGTWTVACVGLFRCCSVSWNRLTSSGRSSGRVLLMVVLSNVLVNVTRASSELPRFASCEKTSEFEFELNMHKI